MPAACLIGTAAGIIFDKSQEEWHRRELRTLCWWPQLLEDEWPHLAHRSARL